jgi:transcriptional regulator with XRE-family HTH domain
MNGLLPVRQAELIRESRARAGRWLRELRQRRGLSQRGLAQKVGVEPYTLIAQIESGRGSIPRDRHAIWAHALGIGLDELARTLMRNEGREQVSGNVLPRRTLATCNGEHRFEPRFRSS